MLETAESNRRNLVWSLAVALTIAAISATAAMTHHPMWGIGFGLAAWAYWWLRHRVRRRWQIMRRPVPEEVRAILLDRVTFYATLDEQRRTRFEKLVQIFLDEVAITGVNVKVDSATRVLVAASAVIPIFGFEDFEYGLGEVLIYPDRFNRQYDSTEGERRNILGMVGSHHLSGTMILSKPSLMAGFDQPGDKRNVGIHEFAHLVDARSGSIDGVPPAETNQAATAVDPWVEWVGRELRRDGSFKDIDDYAYTNEAEYFAVLSEYFFENPAQLQSQHPRLYELLRKMYHQDPKKRSGRGRRRRKRKTRRNDPCPCGSGEKYKRCCRPKIVR